MTTRRLECSRKSVFADERVSLVFISVKIKLHRSNLFDQLQLPVLDLVDLHHSGSSGEVSHTNKLGAAGNPSALEHRVVQTLLQVRDDLRLLEGC